MHDFDGADLARLLAVPLLPLAGWLIQVFFGRKLPRQGDWLLTGLMFVGLGIALYELAKCLGVWSQDFRVESRAMGYGWSWLTSRDGTPNVVAGILYDWISRGRVHPAYLWGGGWILISVPLRLGVSTTAAWHAFATWATS